MVGWLKAYWNGVLSEQLFEELFDDRCDEMEPHFKITMWAFEIVRDLKPLRWETIESVLCSLYMAVRFTSDYDLHTIE